MGSLLTECLKRLEYRGYDSVGIAIASGGSLVVRKGAGKIDEVSRRLAFYEVDGLGGVGHTRWATHGPPTDTNAHPHTDCGKRFAVVHNGVIENFSELRRLLESLGHRFESETDTEVVPHLAEEFVRRGLGVYEAFINAVSMLRGSFALVMIDAENPQRLYFARNTSPLVLGLSDWAFFVASDIPAFLSYTNRVVVLNDWEVGYVDASTGEVVVEALQHSSSGVVRRRVDLSKRVIVVEWRPEEAEKGGYPHFMIKEIHEQPQAIAQTVAGLRGQPVEEVADLLLRAKRIVVTGAGTSFHASYIAALQLVNMADLPAQAVISSEFRWVSRLLGEGDVLIAVSQSGETIDTLLAVREARRRGAKTVAVVNVVGSTIARESDIAVYMRAGPEIGVAATKTFTSQLVTLAYIAASAAHAAGRLTDSEFRSFASELEALPKRVEEALRLEERVKGLAEALHTKQSAYYLGRGPGLGVAMEGALKLKEVAYIHAEAYPAGESKHGPIALVEPGFPVVFTALSEDEWEALKPNIEEMKARGAFTIAVVPEGFHYDRADEVLRVPRVAEELQGVVSIVPLQLLAYYTAVKRGFDPDKPRNLAKTVTVV